MFRIFGPPGTGKTSSLLDMVDKALEAGTPPQSIGFLAFTRKAANEAKERAAARFRLDPQKDLQYFRTLHSFCFNLSDIQRDQLLGSEHLHELSLKIGFNLAAKSSDEDDDIGSNARDNPMMQLLQLARLKKDPIEKTYQESAVEEPPTKVKFVT